MPHQSLITLRTGGRGLVEITREVDGVVGESGCGVGVAHVFVHHTSASLIIQENADPSARSDLERWFDAHVPDGPVFGTSRYEHTAEGPDDMPAHVRAALTNTSLTIPVCDVRLVLGTWQGVYLFEHRTSPQTRRVSVTVLP